MKTKKYFMIKRNSPKLLGSYLQEFSGNELDKIKKQVNVNDSLLLIEKTMNEDNTESYTNLWTVSEGCEILWQKYVKNRLLYDYTGIVYPIIHLKGKTYFFDYYCEIIKK